MSNSNEDQFVVERIKKFRKSRLLSGLIFPELNKHHEQEHYFCNNWDLVLLPLQE
jgi:hypothetical protein